jgi:hypothetical protein
LETAFLSLFLIFFGTSITVDFTKSRNSRKETIRSSLSSTSQQGYAFSAVAVTKHFEDIFWHVYKFGKESHQDALFEAILECEAFAIKPPASKEENQR